MIINTPETKINLANGIPEITSLYCVVAKRFVSGNTTKEINKTVFFENLSTTLVRSIAKVPPARTLLAMTF